MLPEIVQACRGSKVEVYFDGGIRTGTDVFKALAIGARAVFIGRPILYGLAYQASVIVSPWLRSRTHIIIIQGESGVRQVLSMISHDFRLTMGLAGTCGCVMDQACLIMHYIINVGCTTVSAIDKSFLTTEAQLDFTKTLAKL